MMSWLYGREDDPPYNYKFQPGDLVRLKSGGPIMTVKWEVAPFAAPYVTMAMGIHTNWCDYQGGGHAGVFRPEQLEKAA